MIVIESGAKTGDIRMDKNREMGIIITKLLAKENLGQEEAYEGFRMVLADEVTDMQQGAFLAALTGKGENAEEVAGGWRAVYDLDTKKVDLDDIALVDNCGTGMDSFKTFNISTAASLVAASGGVKIARHGARAITSACGTVDMAEMLGVDMECSVDFVERSIREVGIGLFNGMSPEVHPNALGRILSQISFGSPLNIAASLAHPALPKLAVRGVFSPSMLLPVAEVMQVIGYTRALVCYGEVDGTTKGMDEGSVCGKTHCVLVDEGSIREFSFSPEDFLLKSHDPALLRADPDRETAALAMYRLLAGRGEEARNEAVILNSGLIFYVSGTVDSIETGVEKSRELLLSGAALDTLKKWIEVQNRDVSTGLQTLSDLADVEARA